MKRKTWLLLVVVVAVLAALLAWALAPRPVEVELAPVTRGRFETTIDEDGKTRLADRYVVSAPLAGRLARITLTEGDVVQAGDPLAQLMPVLPALLDERSLREVQARVASAQENVARAGVRVDRAQVAVEQVANEARRNVQLAAQGFIAPTRLEADRLAMQAAQREVDSAAAERRMALHDLEQARAALGVVRQGPGATAQGSFIVRAPAAGRVLRVVQSSEVTVALGAPLLELGDTARLEVVAELLTTDALAAKPGSRVMIERWGGPTTLQGRVRSVEPAAFTKVSALGVEEQRVRVVIDLVSPQSEWQALGDGYRVSVRIVTLSEDDAVQVPVSAVFPLPASDAGAAATGAASATRHAVFVVDGGQARQRVVELGGRNGSMAWIRSGLEPGDEVIVYPPATVREGVRVKARAV